MQLRTRIFSVSLSKFVFRILLIPGKNVDLTIFLSMAIKIKISQIHILIIQKDPSRAVPLRLQGVLRLGQEWWVYLMLCSAQIESIAITVSCIRHAAQSHMACVSCQNLLEYQDWSAFLMRWSVHFFYWFISSLDAVISSVSRHGDHYMNGLRSSNSPCSGVFSFLFVTNIIYVCFIKRFIKTFK